MCERDIIVFFIRLKKDAYKATNDVASEIKKNDSMAKTPPPSSRKMGVRLKKIERRRKKTSRNCQVMYTNAIITNRVPIIQMETIILILTNSHRSRIKIMIEHKIINLTFD